MEITNPALCIWIGLVLYSWGRNGVVESSHVRYEYLQTLSTPSIVSGETRTGYHFQPHRHWINAHQEPSPSPYDLAKLGAIHTLLTDSDVPLWVILLIIGCAIIGLCILMASIIWCIRRAALTTTADPIATADDPTAIVEALPSRGLDHRTIEMFPITLYEPPASASASDPVICSICHDELEHGVPLRTLPCTHGDHVACIDQWLASHATCPICRQEFPVYTASDSHSQ